MILVWVVVLAGLGAWFISRPLFAPAVDRTENPEVAALEAARDTKYREIRDAELNWRAGRIDDAEFRELDAELRRDAINLLNRLERAWERSGEPAGKPSKTANS